MRKEESKNYTDTVLFEHRCACGKLLGKGLLISSTLEIKCNRCNKVTIVLGIGDTLTEHDTHYVILCDTSLNIRDVSPSAVKILGFSKLELLNKTLKDLDPLLEMGAYEHLWKNDIVFDTVQCHLETLHRMMSGTLISVQVNVRFMRHNDVVYILNSVEHLMARDSIEQPKPLSDRPHYSWTYAAKLDAFGVCTYSSAALCALLGYAAQEIVGAPWFSICQLKDQKEKQEAFPKYVKTDAPFRGNMVCKNGDFLAFEHYFVHDYDTADGSAYFRVMSRPRS